MTTETTLHIRTGEGYGGEPYEVGTVIWIPTGHLDHEEGFITTDGTSGPRMAAVVVLTAKSEYIRRDGMSFGVGDEAGYLYSATVRPATSAETAPLLEAVQCAEQQRIAKNRLQGLRRQVLALARENGTLTNDADMPAPLQGASYQDGWERVAVAGDMLEMRSCYTIDTVNYSALVTDTEIAAELLDLMTILQHD